MKNSYKTSKVKLAKRWTGFKTSQGHVQHEKDFGQIWVAQKETEIMKNIFENRFDKDLQCTPPSSVADKLLPKPSSDRLSSPCNPKAPLSSR